jgi:hypothetical protein
VAAPSAYATTDMDCTDLHRALADGLPTGSGVDAHLEHCPACNTLMADEGALAQALHVLSPDSEDLNDLMGATLTAIEADAQSGTRRLSKCSTPSHAALWIGAVLVVMALQVPMGLRPDFDAYPTLLMVLVLAAFLGPALGLVLATTRPLHMAPLPPMVKRGMWLTAIALPLVVAAMPAPHLHPAAVLAGAFMPITIACFVFGTAIMIAFLLLHALLQRRTHADRDNTLLAALIGSLAAAMALQLHCPLNDNAHQVLGHATQGILMTGLLYTWFSARRAR